MGLTIGIDLGTTNTVAAIMDGSHPKTILMMDHESSVRSVVHISKDGNPLVGSRAYDRAEAEPACTAISIKRLMGRQFDDADVQRARERYEYPIEKNPEGSDAQIKLRGRCYSPTELSAMILRKVKDDAEKRLGGVITHAVITVPAYFDPIQKEQTRIAGEMAGLRIKQIIDEPTAAAIAYSLDQAADELQTILVYDLGGGTFDISCLLAQSGMFHQLDIEGDMWLGGDDFDQVIVDYCIQEIRKRHGVDPTHDRGFMFTLRKYAEVAKKELGQMVSTEIMPPGLKSASGEIIDESITISRMQFEQMIEDKVQRSVDLMETALRQADVTADQVDRVLLVGGSTAVPLVRDTLIARFGKDKVSQNIDAMTCVAAGAAKLARDHAGISCPNPKCGHVNALDATACERCGFVLLQEKECHECHKTNPLAAAACTHCDAEFREVEVGGVTPQAIGIEVEGGEYEIIMPKNSPYPSTDPFTRRFLTATAAQKSICIPVYEGQSAEDAKKNKYLGAGILPLDEHVPVDTPVDVSIRLDQNMILLCEARVHFGSVKPFEFRIDPSQGVQRMPSISGGVDGDIEDTINKSWQTSIYLYYYYNIGSVLLDRYAWLVGDVELQDLRRIVTELDDADEKNDESKGRVLVKEADVWSTKNSTAWFFAEAESTCGNPDLDAQIAAKLAKALKRTSSLLSNGGADSIAVLKAQIEDLMTVALADINSGSVDGREAVRDQGKLKREQ